MRRHLAAIAVLAVLAPACDAVPSSFDLDVLETEVEASLVEVYEPDGLTLFGFSCPRIGESATTGDRFACVAEVERQFVRVQVDVTAAATYDWTTLDVVLRMDDTEELVASEMSDQLGDSIALDCGSPNLRVLPIGSSVRCLATDSGRNAVDVLLTVNGPGQVSWEVLA